MATDLSFHERMEGFFADGEKDSQRGDELGKRRGTTFAFEATIDATDLDRFLVDERHTAVVTGFYQANFGPFLGRGQVPIEKGIFNFMSPAPGKARFMEHHHVLTVGGDRYRFDGYKDLEHHPATWDEWEQLTTLRATLAKLPPGSTFDPTTEPDPDKLRNVDPETIVAAGVIHFPAKDTLKLIRSFEVRGTTDSFGAKMRFLELFLGDEARVLLASLRGFDLSGRRRTLSSPSAELDDSYDVVIVGSGYGGGVAAARLSGKGKTVCLLERGKEWRAGDFPSEPWDVPNAIRTDGAPLGLLEFHFDEGIDALVGNGLGGTSLINCNAMLRPDADVLTRAPWPKLPDLAPYYERAELVLTPQKHPAPPLKTLRFRQAAEATDLAPSTDLVPIAVTFSPTDRAEADVHQPACVGCGGCFVGCNFGAKNTVDMNYLAIGQRKGARIFTCVEVQTVEPKGGGYLVHAYDHARQKAVVVRAKEVVLAAGTYGTFGILARSRKAHGLAVSDKLGEGFSGNGDVLGFGYDTDERTQITAGPSITSVARFDQDKGPRERFIVEEGGMPWPLVPVAKDALPLVNAAEGKAHGGVWHGVRSWLREQADVLGFESAGALNHSLMYFAMSFEDAPGRLVLKPDGKAGVVWPGVANQKFADRSDDAMQKITEAAGGTYLKNPLSRSFLGDALITAHPIGGCAMAAGPEGGVVSAKGEVFGAPGLFVADGSILATALGANPALTIAALAEWITEQIAAAWTTDTAASEAAKKEGPAP